MFKEKYFDSPPDDIEIFKNEEQEKIDAGDEPEPIELGEFELHKYQAKDGYQGPPDAHAADQQWVGTCTDTPQRPAVAAEAMLRVAGDVAGEGPLSSHRGRVG